MPKGDGLTQKQRKLVKGMVAGKPQGEAAKAAGLNESYASQVLKTPKLKLAIADLMDKVGLSDDKLLEKHKQLLEAQKVVSAVGGKDAGAGSVDFIEVPDHPVQAKALEMAYKLKGKFVEKQEVTFPEGLSVTVKFKSPGDA